ncbi:DNA gyrase inhibitor YacG [Thauera sp. WH-2]|jgi:hypothetical protein|uniref:DNA gyrase inhibitor YacG n=1 Tax=unclassified Thauera TaxID=2609274 RepID=UPI002A3B7444|nr:DNA gyrase inhibitor YacG [Thauera sp.]
MTERVRTVNCPTCGKAVPWTPESRHRPFCSARCRQIDLGAWASEAYRVPTSPPDAPLDDIDFQPPGLGEGRKR